MVQLAELARASRDVAASSGRLDKVRLLAGAILRLAPAERAVGVAWLAGELAQGRVGVGLAALRVALASPPAPAPSLSVADADAAFSRIAAARGKGSAAERTALLSALFATATEEERDFLFRLVTSELRQGALEGVLADAVASAAGVPAAEVRRAAMTAGALPPVAEAALAEGPAGLERFRLRLIEPVRPMLAQTAPDVATALADLGGEAALEWKLDGARIQVHRSGDDVRVFSRTLREVTRAVPEVVGVVRALPARSLVLDGEAIALRPDGAPEPFQTTMRRIGRKLDVERARTELPLSAKFFDVMHLDGEDLLARPARLRHEALASALPPALRVPRLVTADATAAGAFLEDALARGHEGVMAKALDAPYEAGRRGASWLKVKRAHTLDLVVLAAEWGHGRRRGFLSNLHLGARDPAHGGFAMLGKTFKGMTDEMLAWQTERLRALAIGESDEGVVHVRPELVVEVAFDGIQASPRYPAGLALRFARVRRYRSDKGPAEADTIETVRRLHARGTSAP